MTSLDRERFRDLLGLSDRASFDAPRLKIGATVERSDYTECHLHLQAGGMEIPGRMLLPSGTARGPAVLYCHAHGNVYDIGSAELTDGRPALQGPYGQTLAQRGIASLSIDLAPFGERQSEGPEGALSKATLWRGQPLIGQMLRDLSDALAALRAHPRVDGDRVATLGLSMGATHAYMLAALHPEIAACGHLCAFSDIAPLIEAGTHDLHGPYMTVPGLLRHGDLSDVAALIAPRPQLICAGATDLLTPPEALEPAIERVRHAYVGAPNALRVEISATTGHVETPAMREAVLEFLCDVLEV